MIRGRTLAAGVGAVVVIAAVPWLARSRGGTSVPTVTVTAAPFERRILAEGNLETAEATPVAAPLDAQGALKVAWLVPDGTSVKTGDVVVRFDPTEMEKSLRDGESDRSTAESRMAGTRAETGGTIRNLERDGAQAREELAAANRYKIDDPDVFSRQEIIRSQIDRTLATQRIDTADATRKVRQSLAKVDLDLIDIERRKAGISIDRAKKGLDALEIKAPHDGILVYQRDWRGEITKVGDSVWPGESVAEIPNLGTLQARVFVLEADAGGLTPGLPAKVTIEAHPGVVYDATIQKVDTLAKRREGWIPVQYFGTALAFKTTDPTSMKPGERVRAVLSLDARPAALSVPRNAVFEKDGKKIVWRKKGSGFTPVEVTLGPAAVGRVVIEKGLSEGEVVALADPTAAAAGTREAARSAGAGSPTAIGGGR
jgi:HlyD family secretion protein